MRTSLIIIGIVGFLQASCSSCSDGGSVHDAGPGTDTDADTDTDTDVDSDTDSDSDTDTDSDTVSDAGPWEWTDLPPSEDCGPGCQQLTYGGGVRDGEWDVWDNFVVFNTYPDSTIGVVDVVNRRQLMVPVPVEECASPDIDCYGQYPSIYQNYVYYGLLANSPHRSILVRADILGHTQELWYSTVDTGEDGWESIKATDVYGDRITSTGGCDNASVNELCYFNLSAPGEATVLAGSMYGAPANVWGDIAVWWSYDGGGDTVDVVKYDFISSELSYITHDPESQIYTRFQGNTVVYMDLRFGDNLLMGDWNHAAVFAYDLSTSESKQITNAEWIAANPDVYDNIVVWQDFRASANPNNKMSLSGTEIWGYNLTTETEFQVTNLPGRIKQTPRIWEDKVFVHMSVGSGGDGIFMFDLPDGAK
jgi:beta propeller repeat protein